MGRARFCLVMPFRNEATRLLPVLDSIASQTIDTGMAHLVAVDRGSTDCGAEIVAAWAQRTGFPTTVLRVEDPSLAAALNAGIAHAADDETVVRLDVHTLYDDDYLLVIEDEFARAAPDVVCVGGAPAIVEGARFDEALVASLMTNRMGLRARAFRAWRPGVLEAMRGFDERWGGDEGAELAARIQEAGGAVRLVPLPCRYQSVRGPFATLVHAARSGFWRAHTVLRHLRVLRPRALASPLALIAAVALLFSPLRPVLVLAALTFAALVILRRDRGESPLVTAASLVYVPLAHGAFALGWLAGALVALRGAKGVATRTRRGAAAS